MSEFIGREEYVRLICNGYLILGKPIPEEFWDEWDVIQAKTARDKKAEERLLEIPPEPMEVWAIMENGLEFRLSQDKPATTTVTLTAIVPVTGMFRYFQLRRATGVVLAQFDGNMTTKALLSGDSLHLSLDAAQVLRLLTGA